MRAEFKEKSFSRNPYPVSCPEPGHSDMERSKAKTGQPVFESKNL